MSYPVYTVPAGDVLPILFDTFDGGTGASITMTGLAVTDIEIYKDGSVTQRASDAGYTLLDTDGIDFDTITGIHGFSIDTGDNTDVGFYAVGAWYHVVVSAITVDAQTVNFIAAAFRIVAAEDAAGVPDVNVTHFGGSAGTFASGRPDVNTTHIAGTAQTGNDVGADVNEILLDTAEIGAAGAGLTAINLPDQTMNITGDITGNLSGSVGSVTGNVGGNVTGSVGSVATGGITSGSFAAGALDAVWSVATRTLTAFDASFKTGYSLSAAGVQAIWDALTSALTTVGSIGKLLVDNVNATISSRSSHSAADVWSSATRTLTAATNITSTGGTTVPQTGDSFARLGAPAGASIAADLVAIEAQTDDIGAAGAGLTAIPWNASWDAEVESEALDALNTILADSIPADGTLPTARQALYMLVQLLTEAAVSSTTVTVKKADGSTTLFTLTINDATTPTSITRAT